MMCSRCRGLMVEDFSLELDLLADDIPILAWRCINCGHITDPVMERNRMVGASQSTLVARVQVEPTH